MSNDKVDDSEKADAERLRWMIDGNGYFLEEAGLTGGPSKEDQDYVRSEIDEAMRYSADQ